MKLSATAASAVTLGSGKRSATSAIAGAATGEDAAGLQRGLDPLGVGGGILERGVDGRQRVGPELLRHVRAASAASAGFWL